MAETKFILSALFWVFGVPVITLGILSNMDSWKSTVLFLLSGALLFVKIFYFIVDKDQQRRKKEMDLEEQRDSLDKKKGK